MSFLRETVDRTSWHDACLAARADGATYFDFLSATELADGSGVDWLLHVAVPGTSPIIHRFIGTSVRYDESVDSIADVFTGAAWHEREAHEMFGLYFTGFADMQPLLLADASLRPLRKSFVFTQREGRPWPGAEGRKRPLGVTGEGGVE
jgi:NADH-quinone oxidoreductase subunit C